MSVSHKVVLVVNYYYEIIWGRNVGAIHLSLISLLIFPPFLSTLLCMCTCIVTSLVTVGVTGGVVSVLMHVCSPVWGWCFGLWLQGERVEKLFCRPSPLSSPVSALSEVSLHGL